MVHVLRHYTSNQPRRALKMRTRILVFAVFLAVALTGCSNRSHAAVGPACSPGLTRSIVTEEGQPGCQQILPGDVQVAQVATPNQPLLGGDIRTRAQLAAAIRSSDAALFPMTPRTFSQWLRSNVGPAAPLVMDDSDRQELATWIEENTTEMACTTDRIRMYFISTPTTLNGVQDECKQGQVFIAYRRPNGAEDPILSLPGRELLRPGRPAGQVAAAPPAPQPAPAPAPQAQAEPPPAAQAVSQNCPCAPPIAPPPAPAPAAAAPPPAPAPAVAQARPPAPAAAPAATTAPQPITPAAEAEALRTALAQAEVTIKELAAANTKLAASAQQATTPARATVPQTPTPAALPVRQVAQLVQPPVAGGQDTPVPLKTTAAPIQDAVVAYLKSTDYYWVAVPALASRGPALRNDALDLQCRVGHNNDDIGAKVLDGLTRGTAVRTIQLPSATLILTNTKPVQGGVVTVENNIGQANGGTKTLRYFQSADGTITIPVIVPVGLDGKVGVPKSIMNENVGVELYTGIAGFVYPCFGSLVRSNVLKISKESVIMPVVVFGN